MAKYIDADALKEQRPENLNPTHIDHDVAQYDKGWNACNEYWFDLIEQMPAADVEPVRHEKWIETFHNDLWFCSNCKLAIDDLMVPGRHYNFCPRCGAKMDGGRLSCNTCKWHNRECYTSEPYEGRTGKVAGDDWCEFYHQKKDGGSED